VNQAWTIDWRNRKPGADLSDISSPGLLAELQIAIAQILDENKVFGGDRVAIVLQSPGDYLAEMRKRLATTAMGIIVMVPEFRNEQHNVWAAQVSVQVIEVPAMARAKSLNVTAQRAAEIVIGQLKDREPIPGVWSQFRPTGMPVLVQNNHSAVSWQVSGACKTIIRGI